MTGFIDTTITDSLRHEGVARELGSRSQRARNEMDLDRICLWLEGPAQIERGLAEYKHWIISGSAVPRRDYLEKPRRTLNPLREPWRLTVLQFVSL